MHPIDPIYLGGSCTGEYRPLLSPLVVPPPPPVIEEDAGLEPGATLPLPAPDHAGLLPVPPGGLYPPLLPRLGLYPWLDPAPDMATPLSGL